MFHRPLLFHHHGLLSLMLRLRGGRNHEARATIISLSPLHAAMVDIAAYGRYSYIPRAEPRKRMARGTKSAALQA
jgi:hypothetical protein